ncbi:MAG: DUF3300 domain-containing protein [Bryobacteraceae bacterium]|jgi:hypothetical protein
MNGSLSRVALVCGLTIFTVMAQDPPAPAAGPDAAAETPTLTPEQLESMVAPIALYPDTLLSQVLVASTYPLEIVEAQQFLDQNPNLTGAALVDAAKKQNWDPSIQSLVPFKDVVKRLNSDIRWTTDLGNAFLAQQADVMSAVQRLRARAKASGKLTDTPQEKVLEQTQDGQTAIEIQPADPQVVYVPTYNPAYFWGPAPGLYPWPPLFYPGIGIGWGWGIGLNLGFYFPGCCGFGGWGWGFGWFGGGIFVNGGFFHRYGFAEFHGGAYGRSAWAHDPAHRGGVPYPHSVAGRFGGGNVRGAEARPSAGAVRSNLSRGDAERSNNHSAFGGVQNGSKARQQSDHGFSSMGSQRTAPAFHGGGGGGFHGGGGGGHAGGGRR